MIEAWVKTILGTLWVVVTVVVYVGAGIWMHLSLGGDAGPSWFFGGAILMGLTGAAPFIIHDSITTP